MAALLDAGADENVMKRAVESLPLSGFEVQVSRVKKSGLDACDFNVVLDEAHENHDHDMEYLYGHEEGHHHDHEEEHHHHDHEEEEHHHHHDHEEEHHHHDHEEEHHRHDHGEGHHHHHEHRGMKEVTEIINGGTMTDGARKLALRIFEILGQAEAKAHGESLETVHFHEVGAVDSIVDIVAAAVCLDNLGVSQVIIPVLGEGSGTVRCQHGILPVPVPAVSNIAAAHGLKLHMTDTFGELVTPTGAAIAAAVRTAEKLPENFKIVKIGLGAGKRAYERPSIVRAMVIETEEEKKAELFKLESNIDDCTGEVLGYVMEKLLAAGARDVNYTPVYMKKNRPAYQLNVICSADRLEELEQIIFAETTTIGIRRIAITRSELSREMRQVETKFGTVQVKVCALKNGQKKVYPEYDSVAELAKKEKKAFREVFAEAERCGYDSL